MSLTRAKLVRVRKRIERAEEHLLDALSELRSARDPLTDQGPVATNIDIDLEHAINVGEGALRLAQEAKHQTHATTPPESK